MAISHAVPLSAKCFTQEHLDLSLKYISPDVYPGLYAKSDLPKNIEFPSENKNWNFSFKEFGEKSVDIIWFYWIMNSIHPINQKPVQ